MPLCPTCGPITGRHTDRKCPYYRDASALLELRSDISVSRETFRSRETRASVEGDTPEGYVPTRRYTVRQWVAMLQAADAGTLRYAT